MGSCCRKPSSSGASPDVNGAASGVQTQAERDQDAIQLRGHSTGQASSLAKQPCTTRPLPKIYVALQDYANERIDCIGFKAGDKFVIRTEDPRTLAGQWCDARRKADFAHGRIFFNYFQPLEDISRKPWYVGKVTSGGAESMLRTAGNRIGYFLVRRRQLDSSERREKYHFVDYALSVRIGDEAEAKVQHILIKQTEDGEYYLEYGRTFETIEQLIQLYSHSVACNPKKPWIDPGFPRLPQLIAPCLRFEASPTDSDLLGDLRRSFQLPRDSIKITQWKGAGRFNCETYDGCWKDGPVRLVVKLFSSDTVKGRIMAEARKLSELTHPRLVQLLGICHTPDERQSPTLLVMELCPDGTLLEYLARKYASKSLSPPPPKDIVDMAGQIADGMAYLEQHGITHGDLAARNILMDKNNLKISDTGVYRIVEDKRYAESIAMLRWTAPEAMTEGGQKLAGLLSSRSDVWAFGVVLVEIVQVGRIPYKGEDDKQVLFSVKSGKLMKKPTGCNDDLFCTIKDCWKWNPDARTTFQELKWNLDGFFNASKDVYRTIKRA